MNPPFVVLVMGLPGSGKSFFAKKLANELQATYLSSDLIRKVLFPMPNYRMEEKTTVYQQLADEIMFALSKGEAVVADCTGYLKSIRQILTDKISAAKVAYMIINIQADELLIEKRTSKKREDSDADFDIYLKLKALSEPIEKPHLTVYSTNENIEDMLKEALNYIACQHDQNGD